MALSKQRTIRTEVELREAFRKLWADDPVVSWHWRKSEARRDPRADAVADVFVDGRRTTFHIEFKLAPNARDIHRLTEQRRPKPSLLVAPRLTETLVSLCRERKLSCADLNGRLWLRAAGVVVDRQPGPKAKYRPAIPFPDPFSLKSSRLARTLLSHHDRKWSHTELVERTGLSKGLVSRLSRYLVDQGLLAQQDRVLFVHRWDALLDAWAKQDDWLKRTTIQQYSLLDVEPEEIAGRAFSLLSPRHSLVFTQWFAANLRRPYTLPPVVSAYVRQFPDESIERQLRARRVSDGGSLWLIVPKDDGVFRETQTAGGVILACDVQIYLDLLQAGLRGPEQAQAMREWDDFGKPAI